MAVSEPHHTDRGTVVGITSARKKKYSGKKKESNLVSRQPSRFTKKQTIGAGKRVFVERKIVKYRVPLNTPGYKVLQLYQSNIDSLEQLLASLPPASYTKYSWICCQVIAMRYLLFDRTLPSLQRDKKNQPMIHVTMQ